MRFRKRILEVGRYESPDGEVVVTPERLKHWSQTFKKMRAAKLGIPIGWDHHDDPNLSKPVQLGGGKRRKAQDVVGYVDGFQVGKDGKTAELTIDIPRAEDAEKVKHNLAYVSPVIFGEWKDGRGRVYEDCITRVDLVQHPVDNSQTPFEPAEVRCALRMGLEVGKPETFRMAEDSMADELDDLDLQDQEGAEESEDTTATDRVANVIAALASMQIILPDDTTAENFFERVEAALLTAAAMGAGESDLGDLEEAEPDQFAALSLMRNKMTSFEKKLIAHATSRQRERVVKRLGALLEVGRCTPAAHKAQVAASGAIRLSLNGKGEHVGSTVESWIESREAVPKGTFWDSEKRTRMSKLTESPHPKGIHGAVTHEEADEIVKQIFARR